MNATNQCQNCREEFLINPDDQTFYEKIKVPPPTFCWLCRAQRRMAFRNERILYKTKSDLSGQDMFSMYPQDAGYRVYERKEFLSDSWDALEYGRNYDWDQPFFKQFDDLLHNVPLKSSNLVNPVRSDYSSNFTDPKNCYLCFNGNSSEDCMYSHGITNCKGCVDVSHLSKSENCYDSFWLTSCASSFGCNTCESSYNMWFCKNCVGCSDCVGCVGLRKKQYFIFNQPYSKESYSGELKKLDLGSRRSYDAIKTRAQEFWKGFPIKNLEGYNNSAVTGNYIEHSKNVKNSFMVREGENLRYCQYVQELPGCKDCYDWSVWGDNGELVYECHASGFGVNNIKFCLFTQESSRDLEYCMVCAASSDLFGCVSLRKKQYCILNKQYTKEEYETLIPKIRQHMNDIPYQDKLGRVYKYGEYFPVELSPVGYNTSMAMEYFPLTKDEALRQGYKWHDSTERNYKLTLKAADLNDFINGVPDSITNEVVSCAHIGSNCNQLCTTAFRITPEELRFYKTFHLPLPQLCHNCRTFERLKERTGLKLFNRICDCGGAISKNGSYTNTNSHSHGLSPCSHKFETCYTPESLESVYCETCYQFEFV